MLRDETVRGQHKRALGIVLANDYDTNSIEPKVWTALIDLLFNLKLKYAHALIGLHRQVRAKRKTSCPGINFPSQRLKHWIEHDFPRQRDAHIAQEIESQYGP